MDGGLVLFVLVMAAVVLVIALLWRHRRSALARGIGAAGAAYNEFHGQGRPPVIAAAPARDEDDPER